MPQETTAANKLLLYYRDVTYKQIIILILIQYLLKRDRPC